MSDLAVSNPDTTGYPSAACDVLARLDDIGNEPRYVGKLSAHDNGMLEVTGFEYPIGYSGRVIATDGREISAEVVGFKGSRTLMIPMVQDAPLRSGSRVLPYAKSNQAAVGQCFETDRHWYSSAKWFAYHGAGTANGHNCRLGSRQVDVDQPDTGRCRG